MSLRIGDIKKFYTLLGDNGVYLLKCLQENSYDEKLSKLEISFTVMVVFCRYLSATVFDV